MKKNLLLLAAAFAATTLMVGCAMFSSEKDEGAANLKKLNKLEEQARNPEKIEKTGDQKIVAFVDASKVLYERARLLVDFVGGNLGHSDDSHFCVFLELFGQRRIPLPEQVRSDGTRTGGLPVFIREQIRIADSA